MMSESNREELAKVLKEALLSEERAVPIYNRHLESLLQLTGISEDESAKVRSVLEILVRESTLHKVTVEKIISNLL